MRPLTRNERSLLGVLVFVVWAIGTVTGLRWITATQTKLDQDLTNARADQLDAQATLIDKPMWDSRAGWIASHQTALTDEILAGANLQNALQHSASENHLDVQSSKIEENDASESSATLPSVAVSIEIKGPMQSVIVWINTFQSSKDLIAIEYCNLKMDNDQKNMTCNLKLRQFFQAKS